MGASAEAGLRAPALQRLIDLTHQGLEAAIETAPEASSAIETIFARLERVSGSRPDPAPGRLPAGRHLDRALAQAVRSRTVAAEVARAFGALEPMLRWKRRPPSGRDPDGFQDNHANAMIIGPEGIEARDDVWVGVSLMAPDTRYPDHTHPPEELYLVLSEGEWRQQDGPWRAPGFAGLVHNPPHVVHSMRSESSPLLAIWCLLVA